MQPLHPTADSVSIADILSACMLALPFPPFVVPAPRARTFYARSIPLGKIARVSFAVLQQCFDLFFASWSSACCWRAAGVEENNDVSIVTSASVFPPIRLPHRTCKLCTYLALFPLCFVLRITTGASQKLCNLCTFSSLERNFSEALWFNSISSYLKNRILICFPSNSSNSCANWNVKSIFVSRFFFFSFSVLRYAIPTQVCSPSLQSMFGLWKEFSLKLFDLNFPENNIWSFGLYRWCL
jgi:hypothetical protein